MGFFIAVGALVLLAVLPIGFRLRYNQAGFTVGLVLGPFTLALYPQKRTRKQKTSSQESKSQKKSKQSTKASGQSKQGGKLSDFQEIIERILKFLGDFRRGIVIRNLQLQLTLAADDPSDLACNYGRAWAALGNLYPLLERTFTIRKRELSVACDFLSEQTVIYFYGDAIIPLGRLLRLAGVHGIAILRSYLKLRKLRKGGNQL